MTNQSAHPEAGDDNGIAPDGGSTTGMPRWVKVFGLIVLALIALFIILNLVGDHGPGRHGRGAPTPITLIAEDGDLGGVDRSGR